MENETKNVEKFFGGKENANYHELSINHLVIELIGTKNLLLIYSAFTFSHAAQAATKFR